MPIVETPIRPVQRLIEHRTNQKEEDREYVRGWERGFHDALKCLLSSEARGRIFMEADRRFKD